MSRKGLRAAGSEPGLERQLPGQQVLCEWFARCDRPAAGTVLHPVLGPVPTCERCAARLGLALDRWLPEGQAVADA